MSIFDTNTPHPLETLYTECKDIAAYIIPGNMMHYDSNCGSIKHDIMVELKDRGLLTKRFLSVRDITDNDFNKIAYVTVAEGVYIRGIPTYVVRFYYVKNHACVCAENEDNNYNNYYIYTNPAIVGLFQFTVGISGIIDGSIQQ